MKSLIKFLAVILPIILSSCNKNETTLSKETTVSNHKLNSRSGSFYHDYKYDNHTYRLWFNDEDTTGVPINTSTADSLEDAIGSNELTLIHDDRYSNLTIIENIMSDYNNECDTSFQLSPTGNAEIVTFYEHINYGGSSFSFDALNTGTWIARVINGNTCRLEWNLPSLTSLWLNYPTTTWNDVISSFKMHQSGAAKAWMDARGFSGSGTGIQFAMFRDAGYPQTPGGAYLEVWNMHPNYGTQDGDWSVPNLTKESWGYFWNACMNDRISAISIVFCKSTNCSGGCSSYHDLY
jgi:hypothetical protein